jgi:UDP-2,3-diacylglucosamine pyrophosphatase LpxH
MSRSEDFHLDGAFARFVEWRRGAGTEHQRPWRLVILGDFLDFTRVELGAAGEDRRRLDVGTEAALAKLERIAAGHPKVFAALRSLVDSGTPLQLIPGNHDLELLHPAVQARLRQLLLPAFGRPAAAISFQPWITGVPGLLYAEHGQQHHDLNNVTELLCWSQQSLPELPLGSLLPEYLHALMDAADPSQVPLEPSLGRLAAAARARPLRMVAALPAHAGLLRALGRHVAERSGRRGERARPAYRRETLARHAAAVGLEPSSLVAIDQLAPRSPARMLLRLVRQRLTLARGPGTEGADVRTALRSAAAAVHKLLAASGRTVPFYVFGHTHAAECTAVGNGATYLNSGTWSSMVRGSIGAPTFVEIDSSPSGKARARLAVWDDDRGRCESLATVPP